MALILPSTVEEINMLQSSFDFSAVSPTLYIKDSNRGCMSTDVRRVYKREVSLPSEVQNWNISNFDPYLNFDDNVLTPNPEAESQDDRLVPSEDDSRQRCESFSSVTSAIDDKSLIYRTLNVKTFNTVFMDSGSTCISSDHTYVTPSPTGLVKGLDAEETYQNLDTFFQQGPEIHHTDTMSSVSPVGSPENDSNLEYSLLSNNFPLTSSSSQDTFPSTTVKRPAEMSLDEDLFLMSSVKRTCESPDSSRYVQTRRKNNLASKNCRKTRKEKQREMEIKVAELEKEKEGLKVEVQVLEELIQAHKLKLYAILQKR